MESLLRDEQGRNRQRKRRIAPSQSPASRRRVSKARRESSTTSWVVDEVSHSAPVISSRAPSPDRVSEHTSSGFTVDEVLKLVSSLQRDKDKPQFNNNQLNNVIPEFDPSSKTQSIDSWIRKVNECTNIYNWDEKQTIHFALQKLTGLAKKWFEALPSVVYSWADWQIKLRKAFPSEQNYGRLLEEMLARTTRINENLREYFYDKLTLINRCDISGKKAVDCVIHGILDKSVRNGAQALNCEEPEDLLNFLNSQRPVEMSLVRKRYEPISSRSNNNNNPSSSNDKLVCFNCQGKGHSFYKCPKPLVKCQKCHRVGHDAATCKLEPIALRTDRSANTTNEERKTLTIFTYNNANDKFFKKTVVEGHNYVAYVDFGSECSLMRESDAQCLNLARNCSDLPAIKGFGNSSVTPCYKSNVTIKIDEVEARIEILVVKDEFLRTTLLVGQNFTELPCVTVLKDDLNLFFYNSPDTVEHSPNRYIKLSVAVLTNVEKTGMVEVDSDTPFTGDVYVEGYSSGEPGKEYHLHQGAYSITNGRGHIILTNLGNTDCCLEAGSTLARAVPFVQKQIRCVNKITTNLSSVVEPLDISEIKAGSQVDNNTLNRLYDLLQSYRDCFAKNIGEIGCAKNVEMTIELTDDRPVVYRPYRLSHSEREQVREIIDELLRNDIIVESTSDYASPILMVRKKTGEQRLCIDFRSLNNKTKKDCFPLPLIDDQLTNLSGNRYFTTLDLASGYYQVPMAEECRRYTGFVTPDGHYEFKRMPFGLANAPAVFQRLINKMLGSKRFDSALAYLDDILVPSANLDQGFERLEEVLKLLRENGLTLKLSKCKFFDDTINYLGYEISINGIRPNEGKILAVKEFPTPSSVHEVRQFLGLASYFRRFVKGFGEIARPLTNLLKKEVPFKWTEIECRAFTCLKNKLIERPILSLYDPKLETELHTDASSLGIGGILLQWQINPRVLKPVAYFSRQTTPEERHLHSYELETLAIVCSLRKFRVYLLGINFKVVTDCNALRTTLTKRDLVPRIARWWLQISEFTFDIEFRPGTQMSHVDALSRNSKLNDPIEDSVATVYNIEKDHWLFALQIADPDISRIVKVLKPENDEECKDIKKNYIIKDHKVYRKVGEKLCLVVPRTARFQICRANHDEIGHLGIAKTVERIQDQFWFPKLRRFVRKYVKSCVECAYNKDSASRKKTGYLYPIQKVAIPFHTVHLDHLGPFVKSKKKNAYVLTIVDGFTKYLFVKPVKDTKTKTTIKVLEQIFFDFGLPSRIISDRGTSFTSKLFKDFCDLYGIKHVLNAVACPRANGQAERFNQTILNSMSKYSLGKDERDWDTFLGKIQWGINNTVNTSTQKTASEALFGMKFRDILANKLDICLENIPNNINNVRDEVSTNIELNQTKQKQAHDAGRAPATVYKEGDLVKITRTNYYNQGNSTKLLLKFIGPFKILKALGNDRYKIIDIPGFSKKKRQFDSVVAADRIRPWISVESLKPDTDKSDSSSDSDDDSVPLSELKSR